MGDQPDEPQIERPEDAIEDLEAPEEVADEVEGGMGKLKDEYPFK